jgi:ribosomal protein S18 acetylase RimI-like enzyme
MELIDVVLKDSNQKDYEIYSMVDDEDQPIGYICYGPTPMTQATFDHYWIAVDPGYQAQGIGSRLLEFLEEGIKERKGRLILVDTSCIAEYDKGQKFCFQKGFQQVARVRDYYWPRYDHITFWKRLV